MRWYVLAVLCCAHSACVFQSASAGDVQGAEGTGDITFLWSLDGQSCAKTPQVRSIRATIVGPYGSEPLEPDYACSWNGVDGITLQKFQAGNYTFTLDALDASGQALYTATGSVYVQRNLNVRVPVTLRSVSQRRLVKISWTFGPEGRSCAKAGVVGPEGVSEVSARIDGQDASTLPCVDTSSGAPVEGGSLWLGAGTHQVQLDGVIERNGEKQTWYSISRSLTVDPEAVGSGEALTLSVNLEVVAAQATFVPAADAQGGRFSCDTSGASALFIRVTDSSSPPRCFPRNAVTGGCGQYSDCAVAAAEGFRVDYLPVAQTHDGSGGRWKATWTADILAFKQLGTNPTPLYEGLLSQSIEAATDLVYSVPMAKKP